jgi:DNA invertase Pin-like site-specific DNA recombinase
MVLVGYACVSTLDQEPSLQEDALRAAACERIFGDRASGALADRPELARALEDARAGNTLAVWRLDCLDRSLRHLVETVTVLEKRGDGLCSLTELIDTTTRGGGLSSTSSRR